MEGKTLQKNAVLSVRSKNSWRLMSQVVCCICLAMGAVVADAGELLVGHDLQVGAYRVERDVTPGRNKVVGTLTNKGRARIRAAKVSFRLFDANGRVIGRASDEVHDLEPGQTWKFHADARGNVSRAHLLRVEAE